MASYIVQAETLNLPEPLADKLRGMRVRLEERGSWVIVTPLTGDFDTDKTTEQDQAEKEPEHDR